jgi:CheY-like chemotaxis protein
MTERVLIVDDEEDLRYVYTRQLRGDGYLLDTAADGEEAIEKIRTNEYAVILTDMRMPRKDGLAVIAAAREHLPDAEIIVLTGHGSLENALQAFKAGNIFEYLLKPLDDIGVLNTVVARAIERRNLRQHNRELFEQLQRAYEELRQKSEMLIQQEKMSAIGVLAAGVAHELNNPLTAVVGFAQMIAEKLKASRPANWSDTEYERALQALENLVQGAHRARDIVGSLLRFARATKPDARALIDINQTLRDAFVFTEHLLLRHGIALEKRLTPELPPVWGNAARLQHVFTNLLINAQQATPSGGVGARPHRTRRRAERRVGAYRRHRRRHPARRAGTNLRAVLHPQGARHRAGAVYRQADYRRARRRNPRRERTRQGRALLGVSACRRRTLHRPYPARAGGLTAP